MTTSHTFAAKAARHDRDAWAQPSWWRGPEVLVTLFWLLAMSATLAYGATVANLTLAAACN